MANQQPSGQGRNANNNSGARSKRISFDPKWLIYFVIILSVIITTICLNVNRNNDSVSKITGIIDADNGDTKINWERFPTKEIELTESLNITTSGTYHLTGAIEGGSISINAGVEGVVRLILDNVSITNSDGPAIYCQNGDDLVIETVGNTYLEDGYNYSTDYDEDVTGAIYSKADLAFQGEGRLIIRGQYQDAIVGKDDVKFNSGEYDITATDDGIRGKDSVYVVNGDITIEAGADGIKSTNETDAGKGFVMIEGGNFNITAGAKGIKATKSLLFYDGNYMLNTYDDALHSNSYVGIMGGIYNISSGDDGIHADRELIIDNGEITIARSYEGIEAQAITINGGNISITSSDDGMNAGGGADASANNRPGAGMFDADENCVLLIAGGKVYVNASGDGIDSNGWLYFNGGEVIVDGPTNNGNGALDAGMGIAMNGGSVIAVGSSGMAETLGLNSSVYNVSIYLDSAMEPNTEIEIKNAAGDTILGHTAQKSFNHIAVGSETFRLGNTYTIYLNGEAYDSFTITNTVTTVGNSNMNQQMTPGNNQDGNQQMMPGRNGANRR